MAPTYPVCPTEITSDRSDRRRPPRSLGVQGTSSPVGSAEQTEGVVHGNLATDVIHSGDRSPPGIGNARRLEERTG
jgi:hypothetical protein